jgi:predicted  nucleic acid-binding Zn-ribbon protein
MIMENNCTCTNCNTQVDTSTDTTELRAACPSCGSSARNYYVHIEESVVLRDGLGLKAKRPGQKRPYFESKSVPNQSVTREKVVHLERVFDRDNNRYFEQVTDYETGEVIHKCDEPLSDHVGHGSAKSKT